VPKTHSSFFRMLSAQRRVRILRLLREHRDPTVDDLATELKVGVPTVSRQLQLLRMNDLVTYRQDGQTRHYELNEKEIGERVALFLQEMGITLPTL